MRKAQRRSDADVLVDPPRPVEARFELAAARIVDTWLGARALRVSADDFRIARDFLAHEGCDVEEVPGVLVRVRGVGAGAMTREEAVVIALRRLAARAARRRRRLAAACTLVREVARVAEASAVPRLGA